MSHPRGLLARAGVTLLNLLAPGLGLLRVGQPRRAFILYGSSAAAFALLILALWSMPNLSAWPYAALVVGFVSVELVILGLALSWTWRMGRALPDQRPRSSRWYSVLIAALAAFTISGAMTGITKTLYRNFYMPSEGMEPTLMKNDHFVASMRKPMNLQRGELLLVKAASGIYVKRLAALPGDRFSMSNGLVTVNGETAKFRPAGVVRVSYPYTSVTEARLYREKLPDEVGEHSIQDLGESSEDNVAELLIPAGHVFVLGDNRDDSADSRVPRNMGGLEMVPLADVIGRPLFFSWPWQKFGNSLNHAGVR